METTRKCIPGLFSFAIVCYRNWEYLTQTIDSLLMQDYNSIELIVSDDGSVGFPIKEFEDYIEKNKKNNIIDFVVRQSEINEGTVRHIEHCFNCASGEYFMVMAADDVLDNPHSLSTFVNVFEREGQTCDIVMTQTAMYDVSMTKIMEYFVWPDVADAINTDTTDELLKQLCYMPCVPSTSTCYRTKTLEQLGYDKRYFLIEDYPLHLKLAQKNINVCYENCVTVRHRDGGISHGAVKALSDSKKRYLEDSILSRKTALDISKRIGDEQLISFNKWHIASTAHTLYTTGTGIKGIIKYGMHYPKRFILDFCYTNQQFNFSKWIIIVLSLIIANLFSSEISTITCQIFPFCSYDCINTLLNTASILFIFFSVLLIAFKSIVKLIVCFDSFPSELN